jgi:hypothetical protein
MLTDKHIEDSMVALAASMSALQTINISFEKD